jgi:CubicO group peptidase (beta-lactamase class C family)
MKKIFFCSVLLTLFGITSMAQDQQQIKNDAMKAKVIAYFNKQLSDSLYSLAGTAFKKQLSAETFKTVCDNNLFPLGQISSAEFEKIDKGVSKYKAAFDGMLLSMYISLDSTGMLQTFLFQPYKKEKSGALVKSKTDNVLISALDKKMEELVQPYMFSNNIVGLSIGVLKDGKVYFYNYGETKKGNGIIPTAKNLYEIGSITKTFTGILLAKAVTEKKISLNDPVNKYLPKNIPVITYGDDTLKIVHLTNHTSGLPGLPTNFDFTDSVNPYRNYDEKKMMDYLQHATLSQPPGEKFEYCNFGVGLLGYILQQVNKMPFEKMVTTFITSKAGMTDTRQYLLKEDSALFVSGYDDVLTPQSQWDFKAIAAAGCLRSNTTDMLKYAMLNINSTDKNLQKAIVLAHQPTYKNSNQQIGLGWFIQNWGWGEVLFHGGATGGYRSLLGINPATKNAIVVLCNTGVSIDELGVKILGYLDK